MDDAISLANVVGLGLLAQLVEHCNGIAGMVVASIPFEARNISGHLPFISKRIDLFSFHFNELIHLLSLHKYLQNWI